MFVILGFENQRQKGRNFKVLQQHGKASLGYKTQGREGGMEAGGGRAGEREGRGRGRPPRRPRRAPRKAKRQPNKKEGKRREENVQLVNFFSLAGLVVKSTHYFSRRKV